MSRDACRARERDALSIRVPLESEEDAQLDRRERANVPAVIERVEAGEVAGARYHSFPLAGSLATAAAERARAGYGYDAMLLPMVCEVYLNARDAGASTKQQKHIVRACDLLMRGLARVGIIALVDAATGFSDDQARVELAKILEAYIAPELAPWAQKFPHEFFRQVYRLHGWEYQPGVTKGPRYVGKFIMKYVWSGLPPAVVEEVKQRNPANERGQRSKKLFQFLTDETGIPHRDWQISTVTTLMRAAADKEQFDELHARAFGKQQQLRLPYAEVDADERKK